jgi:predicted transposase YbfD/YdcC
MSGSQRQNWEKSLWSEREEKILVAYSFTFKNQWKLYEEFLPGRSAQAIRQHWKELTRSVWVGMVKKQEEEVDLFGEEEPEKVEIQQEEEEKLEEILSWFY